jgi:hypothetical protein
LLAPISSHRGLNPLQEEIFDASLVAAYEGSALRNQCMSARNAHTANKLLNRRHELFSTRSLLSTFTCPLPTSLHFYLRRATAYDN